MTDTWAPRMGADGRTRNGRKVTGLQWNGYCWAGHIAGIGLCFWAPDGREKRTFGTSAHDLVAEWRDPSPAPDCLGIRDTIALAALPALIGPLADPRAVARAAYDHAEAMMAEREART